MPASRADTIFALSTPVGRSGVAVVRMSGDQTFAVVEAIAGRLPKPRYASLRDIFDPDGIKIDSGLVIAFPGPESFTGEDCAELQIHGSVAGVEALLATLGSYPGCRSADAGEFTMRALAEGKLDLTQVEGLADLLDAETALQHRQSLAVFDGALSAEISEWRSKLLRAAALVEATVDFADEDVPVDVWPEVHSLILDVTSKMSKANDGFSAAEIVRNGYQVALVGPPNAGKSTLLNAIAGREVALVSEYAGTTRDMIELRLNLGGALVTIVDLAGMRDAQDPVEAMGIARAREKAAEVDLRVFLSEDDTWKSGILGVDGDLRVLAKADLHQARTGLSVSGRTGEGVDQLLAEIEKRVSASVQSAGIVVRQRHQDALRDGLKVLEDVLAAMSRGQVVEELIASDLRRAVLALETIVGHIGVEDMLGEIFSSFCIGK